MKRVRLLLIGLLAAAVPCSLVIVRAATRSADKADRDKAVKKMSEGNWKEAYDNFSKLALDPADDPRQVGNDLNNGVNCLHQLGRLDEIDDFREKVIAVHAENWRLLETAAQSYLNGEHHGYIVAGKFNRGWHRGGTARYVNSYERDRTRALQLMQQAMEKSKGEKDAGALSDFYLRFANAMMGNRGYYEAWRLQYLTDLSVLPDYEEGYFHYGGQARGAPVNPDGTPVYHSCPKSWKEARSDGERWRWLLLQAMEYSPNRKGEVMFRFAEFLQNQFGPQSMAEYRWFFGRADSDDDTRKDESGTYELHTLGEDETIAKLATGIRRFKLPEEFNYIRIYQQITDDKSYGDQPINALCQEFENRRQYVKAAEYWRRNIKEFGDPNNWKTKRLDQIVKNWGQFEPIVTQPAGQGPSVEFRFRNGTKVSFEAHEIDVKRLLDDVKAYIKSAPKQLDWEKMDISNIGYRLVEKNQKQYLIKQVASWDLDLKPRPNHWDKRITVTTPLQKAGAYLLVGKVEGGNISRIVVWVADTAIVKKPLDNQAYYFVADAVSGQPVAKANLEFFGYRQEWVDDKPNRGGRYVIHTRDFAEFTDADGQCAVKGAQQEQNYSWIVTATTPEGRLAYLGFTNVWYGQYHDQEYNATKTFVITDRPVYRPKQAVKFKFWVNHAKYDQEGKSAFAGRSFSVRANDPKGEKVFQKSYTADEYGGFDGEFELSKEATLGVYYVFIEGGPGGGGNFRVEEYKKPEFEVKVEAPKEPVMLGEKIAAKIEAKYYFGAAVTEAKVKYKVLRSSYSGHWYPVCYWDWFYGPGYWWYAYDYLWYPGWKDWGCWRPVPWWWWGWHRQEPPEVVAEAEVPIGKDGTFSVEIDTAVAKTIHGDTDHKYEITAEVTDQSRRTIVGQGNVLVARKPFKVYAWVDRGHYRVGDVVQSHFNAQTLDNKPVKGKGELRLLKITYGKDLKPVENEVQKWALDTNEEGRCQQQIKASEAGQYRLSYKVTDAKNHAIEGGYVFCIMGEGVAGGEFRFNDIELTPDKQDYKPGEKVKLMVNTNRAGGTVLLFVRPCNGFYLLPKVIRLKGKSVQEEIEVLKRDMPNFFVEGVTVSGGKVYSEMREIVVPPEKRVLTVDVKPSAEKFKPGEKAKVKVKLTDPTGEPYSGSTVIAMYDKAVEYISGGSNVPEIKEFFWKWRRHHQPHAESSLDKGGWNIVRSNEIAMAFLGIFGHLVAEEGDVAQTEAPNSGGAGYFAANGARLRGAVLEQAATPAATGAPPAPGARPMEAGFAKDKADRDEGGGIGGGPQPALVQPTVRTKFADTAFWAAAVQTGKDGTAEVDITMPENLTTWKTRVWAMGMGTTCGEGSAEVVTTKNLLVRLQAPRFFVQKDEVVLSANVHNYLKTKKSVKVVLGPLTDILQATDETADRCTVTKASGVDGVAGYYYEQTIEVEPAGEKRVDWRVKVLQEGEAVVRMKALSDEESDAMEMKFPVFVHGMLKMDSYCGVIRPDKESASVTIKVPAERRPEQSRLEVRYSPTLAGAMVDALPYMVHYPYGCTEQTLNRFLPTVITQKVLMRMGLDLKAIKEKRTNLNAQEIGDDPQRAQDWKRMRAAMARGEIPFDDNPVFDEEVVKDMVKAGLERLTSMQCSDGGWGWFSGWGEHSWPHTTAVVVHGLQIARDNDVAIVPGVLERGIEWLKRYQAKQLELLKLWDRTKQRGKSQADDMDALVYMVLVDEAVYGKKPGQKAADNAEMRDYLYRDRNGLAVYTKAMFGIALHKIGDVEKRDMLIRNVEQFLVKDDENFTAYLRLPENNWWWCWYGSEYEAHAYYLKLLAVTDPKSETASSLVKYLINNRKHATYWNSTRDTAVVIEAFADYIKASGEDKPDMTVEIAIDGKQVKQVKIDKGNLFMFDNRLVLLGREVATGEHKIEFRKKGTGPLYFNAYLTNFTLEDPITKAGLEIKVNRKYYKLVKVEKTIKAEGVRGQAVDQKVEKYERQELANLGTLKSGDLAEIELEIDSKNDYEYILFEDMKAAGFEPVELRSGYNPNDMGAYMELRDERVTFFVHSLARGKHSVSYRVRAEIPGKFSALPTKASAMYAPELKANSDEIKMIIED